MELIRFLIARSRRTLILAVAFGLAGGAANSALLAFLNVAISHRAAVSLRLIFLFIVLCAIAPAVRVISELLLIRLGQQVVYSLRTQLSREVLAVPLRRLEEVGPHRILSVLTDDVPAITNMVSTIPVLCINTGVVVSCLVYMGWLNWKLLGAVLGVVALGIVTYQLGVGRAIQHFRRARQHENDLQKHFQGLVHGIKELKLHHARRQTFLSQVLGNTARSVQDENVSALTIYTVAASWGQLLVFVTIGAVVFFLAGVLGATAAAVTGFALALLYVMSPLQVVMNSVPGIARANLAVANVRDLGLKLSEAAAPEGDKALSELGARQVSLELSGVMYSYYQEDAQGEFTLGPIDLKVVPGELLFITGGNGSGKTNLAKLMMGLYTPVQGTIRCNGETITDSNRAGYRQLFSAVFSDFFLFNSLLGLENSRLDERARELLIKLRLNHKVQVNDGVLSTTELSHGQRKRLALLTACLEDRPICFFDEWAADQDPVFKEFFYLSILPGLKDRGKTVLVITHDDRYFGAADRIVHLESGRITAAMPAALSSAV